jgi:hypothetical protein
LDFSAANVLSFSDPLYISKGPFPEPASPIYDARVLEVDATLPFIKPAAAIWRWHMTLSLLMCSRWSKYSVQVKGNKSCKE